MTEHLHAEHRPPVDQDPSSVGRAAPVKLGQFYPLDDILAVVEDRSRGEQAAQALIDAGVPKGDVDLVDGAWFSEALRAAGRQHGIARRLAQFLPTDESLLVRLYMDEADQGHNIIIVHAPRREDIERAQAALASHGAREMRHYGRHVITDL